MDVDETNQVLSAANVTNVFLTEQAIPETDCYRFSKLYADFFSLGGTVDNTAITASNALQLFDQYMQEMDDAEVPQDGRILYVTPAVYTALKQAEQISRSLAVNTNNGAINRTVRSLDDVTIVRVPSGRMKTAYDFSDGFAPATDAQQISGLKGKFVLSYNDHPDIRTLYKDFNIHEVGRSSPLIHKQGADTPKYKELIITGH
jgi:hypothetical protein